MDRFMIRPNIKLRVRVGSGLVVGSWLALRVLPVAEAIASLTTPSSSVNALANDHPLNFTRGRKFHFIESRSGLFKCTRKNSWPCHFGTSYLAVAITLFKVIQGHQFGTNGKPICDFLLVINTNVPHILHRFQDIADYWSKFHYR